MGFLKKWPVQIKKMSGDILREIDRKGRLVLKLQGTRILGLGIMGIVAKNFLAMQQIVANKIKDVGMTGAYFAVRTVHSRQIPNQRKIAQWKNYAAGQKIAA